MLNATRQERELESGQWGPSLRISETDAAVIDVLLDTYHGDRRIVYNLAPGAFFCGMSKAAELTAKSALSDPATVKTISSYGDVLGWSPLRTRWMASLLKNWDEKTLRENASKAEIGDSKDFGLELMVTAGANQAFMNIVLVLCDTGDEVLLVLPYYFSHLNALTMTGVEPIIVPCNFKTFLPTLEDIRIRITRRTKALVLVNPGNPSGTVIPQQLLDQIVALCHENRIWLIIDEAYKEFVFDRDVYPHYSPPIVEGIIKIYTMSKVYGLAGWRVGAVLYPQSLSEQMRKAQDTNPTHSCRLSDIVAHAALGEELNAKGTPGCAAQRVGAAKEVRDCFLEVLRPLYEASRLQQYFVEPSGAFYLFLPIGIPGTSSSTIPAGHLDVVEVLVEKSGILVSPGHAFGMRNYIRVSYGVISPDVARRAAEALAQGLEYYLDCCGLMHQELALTKQC